MGSNPSVLKRLFFLLLLEEVKVSYVQNCWVSTIVISHIWFFPISVLKKYASSICFSLLFVSYFFWHFIYSWAGKNIKIQLPRGPVHSNFQLPPLEYYLPNWHVMLIPYQLHAVNSLFCSPLQSNKTTEVNFTYCSDYIFICPRAKLTCPRQSDLGFVPALLLYTFLQKQTIIWVLMI